MRRARRGRPRDEAEGEEGAGAEGGREGGGEQEGEVGGITTTNCLTRTLACCYRERRLGALVTWKEKITSSNRSLRSVGTRNFTED